MASRKEYEMLMKISAELGSNYDHTFTKAQAQIIALQREIQNLGRASADITAYQKQQDAIVKTQAKLDDLKAKYKNVEKEYNNTGETSSTLKNRMIDLYDQIQRTSKSLQDHQNSLSSLDARLKEAGVDTSNLASEQARLKDEMDAATGAIEQAGTEGYNFQDALHWIGQAAKAIGVAAVFKEIYKQLKECVDSAVEFETAMAGVKRTVGGSNAEITALGNAFQELSETIPITTTELGAVATTAGQLGIASENIEEFTTVMSMLGTATDMTAEDAATALAQFANITGLTDYARLGSTIAALGDETATTASKVVEMSKMMAAAANMAGFSERDILALSAAVGSLGIEASSGGTAMSTVIQKLYMAIEKGEEDLTNYASVAGMTADEFKESWGKNAIGTLNTFIKGLNDTERNGKSAIVLLDELGISNIRQSKAILGLANSEGLLDKTISKANEAWEENTALQEKAEVMYDTTASQLQIMKNAWNNLRIEVGEYFTPALKEVYGRLTEFAQSLAKTFEQGNKYKQMFQGLSDSSQEMLSVATNTDIATKTINEYLNQLTAETKGTEEYHNILEAMVSTVPELTEVINLETDEIDGGTEAIKRNTEAWAENQRQQALGAYLAEAEAAKLTAKADVTANEVLKSNTEIEIKALEGGLKQVNSEWQAFMSSHSVNGAFNPYTLSAEDRAAYNVLESRRSDYTQRLNDARIKLNDYQDAIEECNEAFQDATVYADAMHEAFVRLTSPSVADEYMTIHGYASGTSSAASGWHWVGEQGPELVNFKGGETVLDARSSAAASAGISVSVAFNIEGDADTGLLQDYADDFADKVISVIQNAQDDALRRAYI